MSSEIYRHAAAAAIAASWTWSSRVEIISWVQGVSVSPKAGYRVYLYHLELDTGCTRCPPMAGWAGRGHCLGRLRSPGTARPAAYQHHTRIT